MPLGVFQIRSRAGTDRWKPPGCPKRWLKSEDPHYPCTDPRIAERYQVGCWSNQASVMYQHFGGDLRKTAEGYGLPAWGGMGNMMGMGAMMDMCPDMGGMGW